MISVVVNLDLALKPTLNRNKCKGVIRFFDLRFGGDDVTHIHTYKHTYIHTSLIYLDTEGKLVRSFEKCDMSSSNTRTKNPLYNI